MGGDGLGHRPRTFHEMTEGNCDRWCVHLLRARVPSLNQEVHDSADDELALFFTPITPPLEIGTGAPQPSIDGPWGPVKLHWPESVQVIHKGTRLKLRGGG